LYRRQVDVDNGDDYCDDCEHWDDRSLNDRSLNDRGLIDVDVYDYDYDYDYGSAVLDDG